MKVYSNVKLKLLKQFLIRSKNVTSVSLLDCIIEEEMKVGELLVKEGVLVLIDVGRVCLFIILVIIIFFHVSALCFINSTRSVILPYHLKSMKCLTSNDPLPK